MQVASFLLLTWISFWSLKAGKQSDLPKCPLTGSWSYEASVSDEFNTSKIDVVKWWDFNPSWTGRKPAYFDRKNVTVKNGSLQLSAKRLNPHKVDIELKARGQDQYTTATIKSKQRSQYGYYEARIKTMKANVCNAFWLYDPLDDDKQYIEGDFSEEIDIMEVFGKAGKPEFERFYWTTIHRHETPYVESLVNKKKTKLANYSFKKQMPYEFYDDYHTFGLHWTKDKLRWYLDGELMYERDNDYFHRPLHVMVDAEIMQTWMGFPKEEELPATMFIDYVRVWKEKE
jgi:beta-glucanase (GH16 family)